MKRPRASLKRFVYRGLAKRIALATLALSAVLSAVIVIDRRDQVSEAAVEMAENRIQIVLTLTWAEANRRGVEPIEVFRQSMEALREARPTQKIGRFVHLRFYGIGGSIVAEFAEEDYPVQEEIDRHLAGGELHFPARGEAWHQSVRFGGRPHVHLVTPIESREGEVVGYGQAVFAASDTTVAAARRDLLKAILWVVGIVFATSAILYPVILTLTRRLATFSEDLLESHLETVQMLGSAIAKRDSDTSAHNFRVTMMAVRLAEVLGVGREKLQQLIKGAFLHDVGKIGISDNILLKPGRLDEAEYAIMKTHVDHGVDIVTRSEWLQDQAEELPSHVAEGVELLAHSSWLGEAADVVGAHHEKYDGSGYPQGLRGEEIPLPARIFAVADVFDALTCQRPYKKPFSFEKSMAILEEGRGTHFDPKVLDAFKNLAESMYRDIAGREDEGLKEELELITVRYFVAGLESLEY